jgi:hypothetical protein
MTYPMTYGGVDVPKKTAYSRTGLICMTLVAASWKRSKERLGNM